jgi:hypothetical protein
MNMINEPLLTRMLRSPITTPGQRQPVCFVIGAIASRILWCCSNRPVATSSRSSGVRACGFPERPTPPVAIEVLNHPMDNYLKYTLDETMATLDKYKAIEPLRKEERRCPTACCKERA